MTIPFFDSNLEILNELRAMDHNSKEYKKLLPKILLEIGGMPFLFNSLKTKDDGKLLVKKYYNNLAATGSFITLMFICIIFVYIITGGKDTNQFNISDVAFFVGGIIFVIVSCILTMVFAFRCKRILLDGVSFLIDIYKFELNSKTGETLGNYKFEKSKINKIAIVVGIAIFVFISTGIPLTNSAINKLFMTQSQEFSKAGMTITLTQEFHEIDQVTQTATYSTSKYLVMSFKEEFNILEQSNISTDISLKEYAKEIIAYNSLDTVIGGSENRPNFVYTEQTNGKEYTYMATVFKGSDAYWSVTFACETKDYKSAQEQFIRWADTVKVT